MAETIDEILNGSDESAKAVDQVADVEEVADVDEGADSATGEDDAQVAAENDTAEKDADENDAAANDEQQQPTMKSELAALAKERERIRQKEAALDAELQRLKGQQSGGGHQQTGDAEKQPTLKELNKQYREALSASLVDPSDEEAAKLVDELEDKIESARMALAAQIQKSVSIQEKTATEFNKVYEELHTAYPFLHPDHPQADGDLNADINAFYEGLLKRGESKPDALRKAVETFAPAQAKKLGVAKPSKSENKSESQSKTASVAHEKLKGGFSEVRNAGNGSRTAKPYSGPTPMEDILGSKSK
jgi:hypothetical protein